MNIRPPLFLTAIYTIMVTVPNAFAYEQDGVYYSDYGSSDACSQYTSYINTYDAFGNYGYITDCSSCVSHAGLYTREYWYQRDYNIEDHVDFGQCTCDSGYWWDGYECSACPSNTGSWTYCSGTTLRCATGYFLYNSNCVSCPSNSNTYTTCSGSTLTCANNYFRQGSTCVSCPSNSECSGTTFSCNKGYYYSSVEGCSRCPAFDNAYTNSSLTSPAYGTTANKGSTKLSDCYLPSGTYYDASGAFYMSNDCTQDDDEQEESSSSSSQQ